MAQESEEQRKETRVDQGLICSPHLWGDLEHVEKSPQIYCNQILCKVFEDIATRELCNNLKTCLNYVFKSLECILLAKIN